MRKRAGVGAIQKKKADAEKFRNIPGLFRLLKNKNKYIENSTF
jgi:hypothetical protein